MKLNSECALAEKSRVARRGESLAGAATVGTVFAPPGSKVVSLLLFLLPPLSLSLRKDINSPLGRMCSLWSRPSGDLNIQGGEGLPESQQWMGSLHVNHRQDMVFGLLCELSTFWSVAHCGMKWLGNSNFM